jgi:hypothetical protein
MTMGLEVSKPPGENRALFSLSRWLQESSMPFINDRSLDLKDSRWSGVDV